MEQQPREWQLLEKIALESFREQKRARRWGIFFRLLTFAYIAIAILLFMQDGENFTPDTMTKASGHTALVRLHGPIMDGELANADDVAAGLRAAFKNDHAKAVIIAINSPGGSPVHAGYIYDEIVRLRGEYPDKKVYAVISEMGASAAYYIASAADEIYADKASLVGSIGVISSGFGFVDAMKKLGIERRVITAGTNKAFLDPFQPEKEDEKLFWKQSLSVIHAQFIEQVRKGRGDRLKEDEKIFSGLIWSGQDALEKGLIDGLGSAGFVAREVIGYEEIVDYSVKPNPMDDFLNQLGMSVGEGVARHLSISAPWQGLPVIR